MTPLLKITAFSILVIVSFSIAWAKNPTDCTGAAPDCTPNPVESGTFGELISKLALIITEVSLPFVILFMVAAAFLFVTAHGNEEQVKRAKTIFWWTMIGAALIVGAWAIAIAIDNFGKMLTA